MADRSSKSHPKESNRLCERCRMLNLESHLDGRDSSYPFVQITKESIQNYCSICVQLQVFFNIPNDGEIDAQEYDNFVLSRHTGSIWPYTYLKVIHPDKLEDILLIPAQIEESSRVASADMTCLPGRFMLGNRPDFTLAREWLRCCQKHHEKSCGQPLTRLTTHLRVIDCRKRELCTVPAETPFAALSYVWGDRVYDTQVVHGRLPDQIPKTVEDCIFAALALEIPYLWIDRYCIDQNNAEEKHHIIRNMDKIYSNAELTIIAAIGKDPHHGLPGVQNTPRRPQISITLGRHKLVSLDRVTSQIQESKWNSWAWTFQEALLSRRQLIFTESQMYFQCTEMHHIEGEHPAFGRETAWRLLSGPAFPRGGTRWSIEDLNTRLSEYYGRQLSYSEDVLNAFEGVFSTFRKLTTRSTSVSHFWGIPLLVGGNREHVSFAAGLNWRVFEAFPEGRLGEDSGKIFPSWSWASLKARKCLYDPEIPYERDLRMDYWWQDGFLEGSEHLSVHVTHTSGKRMDLAGFALQPDDYTNFLRKIEITSLTITGRAPFGPDGVAKFLGIGSGHQHFDDSDELTWTRKDLLAIHLMADSERYNPSLTQSLFHHSGRSVAYTARCLLVEEVESGIYRRVGTWSTSTPIMVIDEDVIRQVQWSLNQMLSKWRIEDKKWELRTITII